VFNFAGEFRGMISQSDVFYSICEYVHLFPLANNTVQNLGIGDRLVLGADEMELRSFYFSLDSAFHV
jgi:hypothetical protein